MFVDDPTEIYPMELPKTCPSCGKDCLQPAWIHRHIVWSGVRCASCGDIFYLFHDEEYGVRLSSEPFVRLIEPVDYEQTKDHPLTERDRYLLCDHTMDDEWEEITEEQGERILRLAGPYDPEVGYVEMELWREEPISVDPDGLIPLALYCNDEWILVSKEKREDMLAQMNDPDYFKIN